MGQLADILKLGYEIFTSYKQKLQMAKEKPWEQILITLETLEKLTLEHVNAINTVCAPVLGDQRDLLSTQEHFHELVINPDFPTAYATARGVLRTSQNLPQLQQDSIQDGIERLLVALKNFQWAAFLLGYDSYNRIRYRSYSLDKSFEDAKKLLSSYTLGVPVTPESEVTALQKSVFEDFRDSMRLFPLDPDIQPDVALDLPYPGTFDNLLTLIAMWCREWQHEVQEALYGHRSLNYAIGRLRVEHFM